MKKIIGAGIGLLALTGVAAAADLAKKAPVYKAPPVIVDPWSWTGFYIGLNAGYSWGKSDTDATFRNNTTGVLLAASSSSFKLNGGIAGGQIGANWQSGVWVLGLEADIQWSGQKGSTNFLCPVIGLGGPCNLITGGPGVGVVPTASFNQKLEWFGTVRGRLGVTPTPTTLLYVTGGLAYGEIETDGVITGTTVLGVATSSTFSQSVVKTGWTVGAGLEGRLSGNWTGKIEYLYMDLGSVSGFGTLLTSNPPLRFDYSSRITDNILRVGINYKFGPYPVVAKY
jgi:outer membrane immunogenic protein